MVWLLAISILCAAAMLRTRATVMDGMQRLAEVPGEDDDPSPVLPDLEGAERLSELSPVQDLIDVGYPAPFLIRYMYNVPAVIHA